MIESFKCKETEKLFRRQASRKLAQSIQKTAMRKLWMVDAATELNELRIPPNNQLEALKKEEEKVNTAYALTSSGEYVLSGMRGMPEMLK